MRTHPLTLAAIVLLFSALILILLTIMPPTAIIPTGLPSAPAAPGNAAGTGAALSPALPSAVVPVFQASSGAEGYQVSGIVDAAVNLLLTPGSGDYNHATGSAMSGGEWWSSNGTATPPATGYWVVAYQQAMLSVAEATLAAIFPPESYFTGTPEALTAARAGGGRSALYGDSIFVGSSTYVLVLVGTPRWVLYTDDTNADQGGVTVALGTSLKIENSSYRQGIGFAGGLGATWAASPSTQCTWRVRQAENNSFSGQGNWTGTGVRLETSSWNTSAFKPGTLVLTPSVLAGPGAIQAGGLPSAPSAPSAIQP